MGRVDRASISLGLLSSDDEEGVAGETDPVGAGLALVSEALDAYTADVVRIADSLRGGGSYPDRREIADAVQAHVDMTVTRVADLVDAVAGDDVAALLSNVNEHAYGATRGALKLVEAGRELGISVSIVREDLATLLAGGDVNYSRYGITSSDVADFRTLEYDGRRILLTEGYEATRRAFATKNAGPRMVADFVPSARHRTRDMCDDAARRGPYPVDRMPFTHPHCACMPKNPRRVTAAQYARAEEAASSWGQ